MDGEIPSLPEEALRCALAKSREPSETGLATGLRVRALWKGYLHLDGGATS